MPSVPTPPATLSSQLRRLGLTRSADDLNDLVARAAKHRWTTVALLEALATAELEDRAHRSLERRFKLRIDPRVSVDRELIGGVRVRVGDEVIDGSVRGMLATMTSGLLKV